MPEIIERAADWQAWDVVEPRGIIQSRTTTWDAAVQACNQIPPLWDLANYVAVNPFLGFASQPMADAARQIRDGLGAQVLPELSFYQEQWRKGTFGTAELQRAAQRAGENPLMLAAILAGESELPLRPGSAVHTVAELYDTHGTNWSDTLARHVALWCAVYVSQEKAVRNKGQADRGLYVAWREAAQIDRSLEIAGLKGWREWVNRLPEQPERAIEQLTERLSIPPHERTAYFYRLLGGVFGWASYLRRTRWEVASSEPGELVDLLAIRVCCDAALTDLLPGKVWPLVQLPADSFVEEEAVRAIFQEALEDGYARRLLDSLAPAPGDAPRARPVVQAVFCIDVRSEPLRRHLEAQQAGIETRGFAGFFGVALDWRADGMSSARCPVLLQPAVHLQGATRNAGANTQRTLKGLQTAPAAAWTFVETLGFAYGLRMVSDALAMFGQQTASEQSGTLSLDVDGRSGMPLQQRVEIAGSILKNTGLGDTTARLVLLCGHGSQSANNPHAAGLDCGACGGHSGAINARVAAALLNDPSVRAGLQVQGWNFPDDTWFVAGVHDTSTDQVTVLDRERVPASHQSDLVQLEQWLSAAGAGVRAERAAALGLADQPRSKLGKLLGWRSRDWSEVRPEWGLARNAAFIAARRARTSGVNLDGRAFLHEYDAASDPDCSVLSLILSAPMVVASWINLQYFASTVDNETFGCGTKALHNRIGSLGVVLGNGGDLRTGLPLQSVQSADGAWYHEPLRLHVVVEALENSIITVLEAHPDVRHLVDNGWVRLFALDPSSSSVSRWVPGLGWEAV